MHCDGFGLSLTTAQFYKILLRSKNIEITHNTTDLVKLTRDMLKECAAVRPSQTKRKPEALIMVPTSLVTVESRLIISAVLSDFRLKFSC